MGGGVANRSENGSFRFHTLYDTQLLKDEIKPKIKLSFSLIKYHALKTYREV
jgi:hypothetical protein